MNYALLIERRAMAEIESLPRPMLERVEPRIRSLLNDPRPAGCRKLQGREGWRVRVGDYRVIYDIDDAGRQVVVRRVVHRRDAYR